MIQYRKLRINISEIRQNGVLCADPIVAWITQEGIFYPCIGEDYIEIEAPPSEEGCIELVVQCSDCSICPPIHIKRCLCTTHADCADCEECIGGFCVPLCPDTLCINDTCVDCIDDDDCEDNLICSGGKCVCPPHMPFQNDKGECVSCLTDSNCPKCTYCLGGECVPLECGDGVCNPITGECEECINNGNCGVNECCVGNKCECCEGFHWDYNLELCVPDPECFTEADCKVCESCVGGNCVEIPLRDGYIAIEEDGECIIVKTCPCGSNDCPHGYTCISYDGNTCICVQCEGVCTSNDDCGEGCFCGGSGICLPSPCHGSCENGADCGEECGCLDGECVPCSSIDCATHPDICANILGCACTGNNCNKINNPCGNECASVFDCGEECTCYNGVCVPCSWFSCDDDSCSDQLGCGCVAGNCENDDTDRECDAEFILEKIDSTCDLVATLSGATNCICNNITALLTADVDLYKQTSDITFTASLRKGNAITKEAALLLPIVGDLTNPNIADNEYPISGSFEVQILLSLSPINGGGSGVSHIYHTEILSIANTGTATTSVISLPNINSIYNSVYVVREITITYTQKTNIVIPNGCTYIAPKLIGTYSQVYNFSLSSTPLAIISKVLESNNTRYPLFTWYKSATPTFTQNSIFRKVYIPQTGGIYRDTLFGLDLIPKGKYPLTDEEGELWGNRYYSVTSDCSCVTQADLSDKLVFCNPDNFEDYFTLANCNTSLLLSSFIPCGVNKDIDDAETRSYTIPDDVQTKYEIWVNGEKKATFEYDATDGMVESTSRSSMNGYIISNDNTAITEVVWKISYDNEDLCIKTYTYDLPIVENIPYVIECPQDNSTTFFVYIDEVSAVGEITNIAVTVPSGATGVATLLSDQWVIELSKGYSFNLLITIIPTGSDTPCLLNLIIPLQNCSSSIGVDLVLSDVKCGGNLIITSLVTGATPPINYLYMVPSPNGGAPNTYTTDTVTLSESQYGNGQVTVIINDGLSNSATDSDAINKQSYVFNYPSSVTVCNGDSYTITLTGSAGASVATNIPGYGTITLPTIITLTGSADAVYTYSSITPVTGNCTFNLTDATTTVDVISLPTATLVSPANPICSSANPTATITGGTPNAYVHYTIDGVAGVKQLNSSGNGSILLPTSEGTHNIVKTSVVLGDCVNTASQSFSVTVNAMPTINIYPNSYTCNETLTSYTVQFTSTTANLSATAPAVITNVGTNLYTASGILTGTSCTITGINGVCTATAITTAYDCSCNNVSVTPPTGNPASYIWCDDDTIPTLSVNSAHKVNWYSAATGGVLLQANSTTYTPSTLDPAYTAPNPKIFYAEAENLGGCKSLRTPIYIHKYAAPGIDIELQQGDNLCAGETVRFNSNIYWGIAPYTYEWTLDDSDCATCSIVGDTDLSYVEVELGSATDTFALTLTVSESSEGACDSSYTYNGTVIDCGVCSGVDCDLQFVTKTFADEMGASWTISDGTISCQIQTPFQGQNASIMCADPTFNGLMDELMTTISNSIQDCWGDACVWTDFEVSYSVNMEEFCDVTLIFKNSPVTFSTWTYILPDNFDDTYCDCSAIVLCDTQTIEIDAAPTTGHNSGRITAITVGSDENICSEFSTTNIVPTSHVGYADHWNAICSTLLDTITNCSDDCVTGTVAVSWANISNVFTITIENSPYTLESIYINGGDAGGGYIEVNTTGCLP